MSVWARTEHTFDKTVFFCVFSLCVCTCSINVSAEVHQRRMHAVLRRSDLSCYDEFSASRKAQKAQHCPFCRVFSPSTATAAEMIQQRECLRAQIASRQKYLLSSNCPNRLHAPRAQLAAEQGSRRLSARASYESVPARAHGQMAQAGCRAGTLPPSII
jgi:hypothetical protein